MLAAELAVVGSSQLSPMSSSVVELGSELAQIADRHIVVAVAAGTFDRSMDIAVEDQRLRRSDA